MRAAIILALLVSVMTTLMPQVARAAPFECPWQPVADKPGDEMAKLLPSGSALGSTAEIDATIQKLQQHGISSGAIVDGLISAYCPVIGNNNGLTEAHKTLALQAYAARVTNIVYTYPGTEKIIVSVPLPPSLVAALQEKAGAAGISVEAWITSLVKQAVIDGVKP